MSIGYKIRVVARDIKCSILGHQYMIVKRYSKNVQKIACKRCHKVFGINHDVRAVLEWDDELDEMIKLCYPNQS
jgi:hypothetical protein